METLTEHELIALIAAYASDISCVSKRAINREYCENHSYKPLGPILRPMVERLAEIAKHLA